MKKYKLELNEEQLQAISHACETCARINMLQLDMVVDHIGEGIVEDKYCEMRDIMDETSKEIRKIIDIKKKSELSMILWDLYQVCRHRLSWDRLKKEGKEKPDFWGVHYDQPFRTSKFELPKIEKD